MRDNVFHITVEIQEVLQKQVTLPIKADDLETAQNFAYEEVRQSYLHAEIVLDEADWVETGEPIVDNDFNERG